MNTIKFNSPPFSYLFLIVAAMTFITSCKKDKNDAKSSQTELLSFGPTGAKHGDTLRFIGNNLTTVTAIDLTGASVPKSSFLQQTDELILIIVPDETEKGYVTLKTTQGDIVSKTELDLDVPIVITSITKEARPGDNITITGKYLNWVNYVTFAKGKVVDSTGFVSKTLDKLVVTVPMDAETGMLILSSGGTEPEDVETDSTLIVTLPMIVSLSPNPIKHADNLTITGTDLDLATKVYFTGVTAADTDFVSQSATQIVVKVPAATVNGKVTLEAASGVKTMSSMDLNVLMPAVTTMAPNPVDPQTNLTITGTNLDLVDSITFQNANPVATFVSQSDIKIVVTVPKGVTEGKITFGVLNSTLTVQSPDILMITGSIPPPVIAFPIYTDAVVTSNWNGYTGGGWGGNKDYGNTTPVREGDKSIKIDYVGGYGSPMQLGGANVDVTTYTTFKISIYGAPGSNGKKVNLGINGTDAYNIQVVEGKWTDYQIPISSLTTSGKITDIILKEYSGTGGFTVYVDDIGLN